MMNTGTNMLKLKNTEQLCFHNTDYSSPLFTEWSCIYSNDNDKVLMLVVNQRVILNLLKDQLE